MKELQIKLLTFCLKNNIQVMTQPRNDQYSLALSLNIFNESEMMFVTHMNLINLAIKVNPKDINKSDVTLSNLSKYDFNLFDSTKNLNKMISLEEEDLYGFAHEIGHAISMMKGFHTQKLANALESMVNKNKSSTVMKLIVEEETRAWDYAKDLLIELGLENLTVFNKVKTDCLSTYTKNKNTPEVIKSFSKEIINKMSA